MKFTEQSAKHLSQNSGMSGVYDIIAECAATCYKSTPKSGENAEVFVNKLRKNKHLAMLEFGTIYLAMPFSANFEDYEIYKFYSSNPYSAIYPLYNNISSAFVSGKMYITTNYRVIVENERWSDLDFMCEPTEHHAQRYTFRIITSIGIARELTRHRVFSFAQESTRYCNYSSKEKFGKEITFVLPSWMDKFDVFIRKFGLPKNKDIDIAPEKDNEFYKYHRYLKGLRECEKAYITLSRYLKPEETRDILPLATKTEICMCGFEYDWAHFFDLRLRGTTGAPHPDMLQLATLIDKAI